MAHYETIYQEKNNFSFGRNWQDFLESLTDERISLAEQSLTTFLGGKDKIKGKTFVDIGCGSGLFSLAAYRLGAKEVVSVDVDEFSIACATYLHKNNESSKNWRIIKGSALDKRFIQSLGTFDVVYSWGVLHHTGDMYKAFEHVISLMKADGLFYLAIYNHGRNPWIGTSEFWLKVKKQYNRSGTLGKKLIYWAYCLYFFADSLVARKNPFKRMRSFKRRGMNWYHNIIDWLGGYPYEYASPEEIINYFAPKHIYCEKLANSYGLACVEYLLRNVGPSLRKSQ